MCSLHIGESVPLPHVEGGILSIQRIECLIYTEERVSLLLLYTKERVSSLHVEESVPLLSVEEADSFSVQRRECHLSTEDRVSLCYM